MLARLLGSSGGGAVYVVSFERFDAINLTIGSSITEATMIVKYVNATDPITHLAKSWNTMNITFDGTKNLFKSGMIHWQPPKDWKIAAYSNGLGCSYGCGQFFGNQLLSQGGVGYAIQIQYIGPSPGPTLNELTQRRWIRYGNINGSLQIVPGWDSRNDRNQDGYVDEVELATLVNPKATARMKQESRVFTLGMYNIYLIVYVYHSLQIRIRIKYVYISEAALFNKKLLC